MPWFLLILSIAAASSNSLFLHCLPKGGRVTAFHAISSLVWIPILFAANRFTLTVSLPVLLWGVGYGVMQALFLFFKAKAMESGPVSVTTLIGNCSLVLSTAVGVLAFDETISLPQILGIAALLLSFVLCTYQRGGGVTSRVWFVASIFFFLFAAGVGILFKCFSSSSEAGHAGDMMLLSAVTMTLVYTAADRISAYAECGSVIPRSLPPRLFLLFSLVCGALSALYNRLNISLAGRFPAAIFYPCFNGGVILLSTLLSMLILRERLPLRRAFGLAAGVAAIVIIGIF